MTDAKHGIQSSCMNFSASKLEDFIFLIIYEKEKHLNLTIKDYSFSF